MTFTLVTGDFVPTGGMDRANLALASFLVRSGESVRLVAHRVSPELLDSDSCTFVRVPKPLRSYLLGSPLLDVAGRFWASRSLKQGGRALVNGGNCVTPAANWVHYLHAAYEDPSSAEGYRAVKAQVSRSYYLATEARALRSARVIIANSRRTRDDIVRTLGVDPARIHVVYYGSDSSRFPIVSEKERTAARAQLGWSADRKTAIFVGALGDRRKGFDTLYKAWRELARDGNWDVDLVVVGSGAQLEVLKAHARSDGLDRSIRFLGFRRDVPLLMAASDVLVAPTRYEAYGLGVHEALCTGIPALVSATAGVAERYPASLHDLLVETVDEPSAWSQALTAWRKNAEASRQKVRGFARTLHDHSWDEMSKQIVELMKEHG